MKLTTGVLKGQQCDDHRIGMVLEVEAMDVFSLLIFSDCFSLVLHLARVSVTTGSMRRYLDPTEVAQAVQLLQDGTSISTRAKKFLPALL